MIYSKDGKKMECGGRNYSSIPTHHGLKCPNRSALERGVTPGCDYDIGDESDALTEQEVNEYYQERSMTAGFRGTHLAWMLILMTTGVLFSGHTWQTFMICGMLALIYMLLSVLQAVWQTFTAWLFKSQIKKGVTSEDYPWWVGAGAWLFFWLKMIAISSSVIYFAKAVL